MPAIGVATAETQQHSSIMDTYHATIYLAGDFQRPFRRDTWPTATCTISPATAGRKKKRLIYIARGLRSTTFGCLAEVRETPSFDDEWRVFSAPHSYFNYTGDNVRDSLCG